MTNLLSADSRRLWKSPILWIVVILTVLISLQSFREERGEQRIAIYGVQEEAEPSPPDGRWAMDEAFFQFSILNGALLAAFLPLHLGADHRDGIFRNKLIVGHRRLTIYLSVLLTAFLAAGLLTAISMAVNAAVGLLTDGAIQTLTSGEFAFCLVCALFCALAFASLYTALTMLIPSRAVAAVVCIGLFGLMSILSGRIESRLNEAEMVQNLIAIVDGKPVLSDPQPNPFYISGSARRILEFILDLLPTGQGAQLSNLEAERFMRFPALSALFIAVTSGIGIGLFSKKDIQ